MRQAAITLMMTMVAAGAWADDPRQSSFTLMRPSLQAIQLDDTANPAMLWIKQGETLWRQRVGTADTACQDCHGDGQSMRGTAARYPVYDGTRARAIDLVGRINLCRTEHQGAPALARESRESLALAGYIGLQSRGMPIAPDTDPRLAAYAAAGEAIYRRRMGQINLSCAQCHDDHAGASLGGTPIPQAHPTGYPLYRSEWQGLGSLERRLRNCMSGMRAAPYAFGAPEHLDLEIFLMRRAAGMTIETPAVRP